MSGKHDHPKRRPTSREVPVALSSPKGPAESSVRTVRFELLAPNAEEVFIAGSFDDWKTTGLPMVRLVNGVWVKELILSPGIYEYLFVVDGVWTPDANAAGSVANPFGGVNSLVTVS